MGHRQCLLVNANVRIARSYALLRSAAPGQARRGAAGQLGVVQPPGLGVAPPVTDWSWLKPSRSEPPRPHTCRGGFSR